MFKLVCICCVHIWVASILYITCASVCLLPVILKSFFIDLGHVEVIDTGQVGGNFVLPDVVDNRLAKLIIFRIVHKFFSILFEFISFRGHCKVSQQKEDLIYFQV